MPRSSVVYATRHTGTYPHRHGHDPHMCNVRRSLTAAHRQLCSLIHARSATRSNLLDQFANRGNTVSSNGRSLSSAAPTMFRAQDFLALLVLRRKATQVLRIEVECDRDVRQEVAERDSELRARRTDDIGSNGPADIELVETYGSERFREGIISPKHRGNDHATPPSCTENYIALALALEYGLRFHSSSVPGG